jgi:peptidoglycan/LPS O-acetylase OafA/YrhL
MLPVFLFHASLQGVFSSPGADWGFLNGMGTTASVAVSYFFILTGFVMTWSRRPNDTARKFWRRRFVRVYPSFLVTFAIALGLIAWAGPSIGLTISRLSAVTQLFLLQAWVPKPGYFDTGNSVTWSLSVDLVFYALFPVLVYAVGKIKPSRLWLCMVFPVGVMCAVSAIALNFLPSHPQMPLGGVGILANWLVFFCPAVRIMECLLGMLLARIVLTGRWVGPRPWLAVLLVVAAYIVSLHVPYLFRLDAITVIPLVLLTGAVATADIEGRGTILDKRLLVWLGEVSFGFYLVHNLVLEFGHRAFGGPEVDGQVQEKTWSMPSGIALLIAAFMLSLLLAWLLHTLVEKPIVRRWSRPKPKPGADAPPGGERSLPSLARLGVPRSQPNPPQPGLSSGHGPSAL